MNSKSSDPYPFVNVLKLSPIELGRSEFQVSYERYFKNRAQSIFIAPSIFLSSQGEETKDGFQLFVQYRFYLSHLFVENNNTLGMYNIGFYAAPYVTGLTYKETYEQGIYDPSSGENVYNLIDDKVNAIEGGALMGVQFDITSRIVLDFYLGGGIRKSNFESSGDSFSQGGIGLFDLAYTGVKPRIGLQIGITF
ncbi:hypothetical protein GCM10007940_18080 [Portibacter lacus]|uniref:DUF3575 domain-containing protein n=2 Tax=Portibacter lacus TaxID=1099794 RepID=A0AA37SS52_9BACT|nr:hypothetical protein GCM10007940_18080 [Portibacter lacus]